MKIAFIVSSLEPGRDGVGDYTRRLAGELIRQGHECQIVALNEKVESRKQKAENRNPTSDLRLLTSGFSETQHSEGTEVPCLRLPGSLGWPERATLARKWVDAFNPGWVSLQFVPFGFHPKGLPFGLPRQLKAIIGSRPLHWMFHELWVLWRFPLSLRKRLLGQGQKLCIRRCLRKLKPPAVATQLPLYQAELKKIGVAADVLPLHGNIPVCPKDKADQWLSGRCKNLAGRKWVKAGFFGNILPTLNPSLFAARVAELKVDGNELLFLSAGKIGEASLKLWHALALEHEASATFLKLGELNEHEASLYFSALDHGLTSYPPELMGKSGSVAAMREHGLPVISCGNLGGNSGQYNTNEFQNQNAADRPWTVKSSADFLLRQLQTKNV
jgi:hypothetical protein